MDEIWPTQDSKWPLWVLFEYLKLQGFDQQVRAALELRAYEGSCIYILLPLLLVRGRKSARGKGESDIRC